MGEIRVRLTEENHRKLNVLCALYRKTQDELINMLVKKARIPGEGLEILIAGEEVEVLKTEPSDFSPED
ncbi:hypothetical protein J7M00_05745 [bacterium]|nr:hypothetical protein [bacterium]